VKCVELVLIKIQAVSLQQDIIMQTPNGSSPDVSDVLRSYEYSMGLLLLWKYVYLIVAPHLPYFSC
jgi:hypothetical protein